MFLYELPVVVKRDGEVLSVVRVIAHRIIEIL